MLPKMDGYQVCEQIKADQKTKNIPIIMLTAKDKGEDLERALEKKADWYIAKPFDYKYLIKKVESLINKSKEDRENKK